MKSIITKIVTLSIAGITFFGMAAPVSAVIQGSAVIPDELWQKAQKIAEENRWVPGLIKQHEKVTGTKIEFQDESRTELQLVPAEDGKIVVTVVQAVSNGKDATKKARKEHEGEFSPEEVYESSHPFTPEADENIIIERLDRQKTIQGKTCVAFHYTMTSTSTFMDDDEHDVTVEGIAWIEEVTGVPYEVENEITSLPIKSGKLTIKTFKHVERYNYVDGQWLPIESELNMGFEYKVFLIKFKGNVNIESLFSQYWKL